MITGGLGSTGVTGTCGDAGGDDTVTVSPLALHVPATAALLASPL
jgi:hypothetical protein